MLDYVRFLDFILFSSCYMVPDEYAVCLTSSLKFVQSPVKVWSCSAARQMP